MSYIDQITVGSATYDIQDSTVPSWAKASAAPVLSVNNKTGVVSLSASDVGALPTTTSIPAAYTATPAALGTASAGSSPSWARGDHVHPKPTYSKSDVGLGNVDNVKQYSSSNPPPYPVTSVNNKTGTITLSASDVGALPSTTAIPSNAADVGAIAAPAQASAGQVLTYNGSSWAAADQGQSLPAGGSAGQALVKASASDYDVEWATPNVKNIWYATCSTGHSVETKVATTTTSDFVLAVGNMVRIRFDNQNSVAWGPKLSVDGTTAKPMSVIHGTTAMYYTWAPGEVVDFVYDGAYFIMTKGANATTSYFGITKLTSDYTGTSEGMAASQKALSSMYAAIMSDVITTEPAGPSATPPSSFIISVAEGGTGADNAADARANLGIGGSFQMTQLYASSSYNASFQLSDNVSNYDLVVVYCGNNTYYFSTVVIPLFNIGYVASTEGVYVHFTLSGTTGTIIAHSSGFFVTGVYGFKYTS